MTYFITYTAHMPYEYWSPECQNNIKYIMEVFDDDNIEYLCAMSQAKTTDDSIKLLMDGLESRNLLDDTVLIFYTDHYAYSMNQDMVSKQKNETDTNLKTKVPFFIYNNGNYIEVIDKVNSTLDILPTIADIFGLDYNPNIYFGDSIFNDEYKGIVVFDDKSWYDGEFYYKEDYIAKENIEYINSVNKYVEDVLKFGGLIIETDYFNIYDIKNKKR